MRHDAASGEGQIVRAGLVLAWIAIAATTVSSRADGPENRISLADCSRYTHPDQVAAAIRAGMACEPAAALYFACQGRWFNNPDLEDAATTACDNEMPNLSDRLTERYETAREACETRYQAPDMRILWSAVRDCKVRLARDWARRHRRK